MATTSPLIKQVTLADLKSKVDPDWCPGCGDFGVLAAFEKALVELQIQPYNVVTISGTGCSSNLPGYINTYGMHTLHGRADVTTKCPIRPFIGLTTPPKISWPICH